MNTRERRTAAIAATRPRVGARAFTKPVPASSRCEMDAAVRAVAKKKDVWPTVGIPDRIRLIDACLNGMGANLNRWVAAELEARGIDPDSDVAGEEWAVVYSVFQQLHTIRQTLLEIGRYGRPVIPGKPRTRGNGQIAVPVFPRGILDKMIWAGVNAEVWIQPGTTREEVLAAQARAYKEPKHPGATVLVLGAGNVSVLVPGDFLTKLFGENKVVVLKMNETNDYLGGIIADAFSPLVDAGILGICYGGPEQGQYLVEHKDIDELHITGSHHTYEAIVFGTGEKGRERKRRRDPLVTKPFTGELGSVSPVIVCPGKWTPAEIEYASRHLAAMLVTNAGFNCLTTRVIITHAAWPQRKIFLASLRRTLAKIPPRPAFYPGAHKRYAAFMAAHPEAECFGEINAGMLPWTFIPGLDWRNSDDICFTTEAFCGLFAETAIAASGTEAFLRAAVNFANNTLWGTLTATLLVRPGDQKRAGMSRAIARAVAGLRYGTVGINTWGFLAYALFNTSWGAFPGHDIYDIQSGTGIVNNWLLLDQVQKTVVSGPFYAVVQPSALTPGYGDTMRALADYGKKRSAAALMHAARAMCKMDFKNTAGRMMPRISRAMQKTGFPCL